MNNSLELPHQQPSLPHQINLSQNHLSELIKIYIGQLPLTLEQHQLASIIQPLADIVQLKIIKGDHIRGPYELFCYAFVTLKTNTQIALDIIKQLQQRFPTWKINLRNQYDRQKHIKNYPFYAPLQPHYQSYTNYFHPDTPLQLKSPLSTSQKTIGQKPCKILVRQLWIGGIPQTCDKPYLTQVTSPYGIIQDIDLLPRFAFVKYKQVSEATTAFEKAQQIAQKLGNPLGFRIYFSDPTRRAFIVSNHYEYDRQSPSLPILFVGFPPNTSANLEMQHIKTVCLKYGPITNEYLRKYQNNQNRSYFLFTYNSIKNALRAKVELGKRKDLLGDKRAEVALLLDEKVIMKGHDLSRTEELFQNDDRCKAVRHFSHNINPPTINYPLYQNIYSVNNYAPYYEPSFYYDTNYYPSFEEAQLPLQKQISNDIDQFLKELLDKNRPDNTSLNNRSSSRQRDILMQLLGDKKDSNLNNQYKNSNQAEHTEPSPQNDSWSGFLTWKNFKRVSVHGHSPSPPLQELSINILSLIQFKNLVLKQPKFLVLQASNSTSQPIFEQYIGRLKQHAGVAMNKHYLMYVMSKTQFSDHLLPILPCQLLVLLQKPTSLTLITNKLVKCQELSPE